MPEFGFRSVDRENRVTVGRMIAGDAASVAERLHALGQVPLLISGEDGARAPRDLGVLFGKPGLSRRAVGEFFIELRLLLRSGIDLSRAMAFLARSARAPRTRDILTRFIHETA